MKQTKKKHIKIFLKEKRKKKRWQQIRNKTKSKIKRKEKLIGMKKKHTWKRMRFAFFFQTRNIHPIKQKYKS